jgi:hypothetical protein
MARCYDNAFTLSYHTLENLQLCPVVDANLELLKRNFSVLDMNRCYSLGVNELFLSGQKANVMYNRKRAGQLLKKMDLDRDGRVSYDEYVLFYIEKWKASESNAENSGLFQDHCDAIYHSMVQPSNYFNTLPRELWNLLMSYLSLPEWLVMQRVRAQWRETFKEWRPDRPIMKTVERGCGWPINSDLHSPFLPPMYRYDQEYVKLSWKGFSPATHRFNCLGYFSFALVDFTGSPIQFFKCVSRSSFARFRC